MSSKEQTDYLEMIAEKKHNKNSLFDTTNEIAQLQRQVGSLALEK
jgi:hypothetical protein